MPIITISRGETSHGIALTNMLAKRLGYRSLSREVLLESAKKYNILEEELQSDIEKPPGLLERFTAKRNRYVIFIKTTLLEAVKQDNIVYHGYAGQVFLEGISHVLKTRIEVPFEHRVQALMDQGTQRKQAEKAVKQADRQRERWLRVVYDREWRDPTFYDMVLNLANISIETACEIIIQAVKRDEFQASASSKAMLNNLLLESEVMSAFAADDELHDQKITVSACDGSVTVRGYIKTKKQRRIIEDTLPRVKGVKDYHVYVNLLSDGFGRQNP